MTITIDTFKEAAEYLRNKGYIVELATKKDCIECQMSFNEYGRFEDPDYDFPTYIYVSGKRYESDEITLALARKAECIIVSWDGGWTFYIGRTCKTATLQDAYENSLEWYVENEKDWEVLEATETAQEAQEATETEQAEQEATETAQEAQEATETAQEAQEATETAQEAQEATETAQEAQEATEPEQAEQEATETAQEATETAQEATETAQEATHHTIYDECTPIWAPIFAYDISHARTADEQRAIIERATASHSDAPASECVEDESWYCTDATAPTDADTAVQEADAAALTRTAEDALYHERAAEQAAQKAKKRPITSFILTLIILIMCITGAGTVAHAFNKTAPALTDAPTTGVEIMATRIPAQKQITTTPATQAPATQAPATQAPATQAPATQKQITTTPATQAPATQAPATQAPATQDPATPTLAQLLAKALEAQKTAQTAPQSPAEAPKGKETLSLKTALKRALMAPKTGTTECVIYSTLYASIRIEEVTTPAPTPAAETPEEAGQESKSAWTIQADTRRIAFMRELRNVARGRAYCEQITALLKAIDQSDDDFIWKTPAFTGLDQALQTAIKSQFEGKECTDAEREECRTALDPHSERVTLHQAAIETAAEALARTAPEWSPLLYEETPAPATLRTAILELQYCIFPIDSSPRARVFRGLEGIDFKTLSTPADYQAACKAASLRAGEPSTAIPPEARARIIQWRSGTVASTSTVVTSTAARLAQVWGMD